MKAYEECLSATSTRDTPWYVVPADDKENARLIVSQIVLDTLEALDMSYPKTTEERQRELLATPACPVMAGAAAATEPGRQAQLQMPNGRHRCRPLPSVSECRY